MRFSRVDDSVGITLAAGVSCGCGTPIGRNSSNLGVIAYATTGAALGVKAIGLAFGTGSGTKVAGYRQKIDCVRRGELEGFPSSLTIPGDVYLGGTTTSALTQTKPAVGTFRQYLGEASGTNQIEVDVEQEADFSPVGD